MIEMADLIGCGPVWVRTGLSPYSVYELRSDRGVAATFKMVLKPGHLRATGECAEGFWGLSTRGALGGCWILRLGGEESGRPPREYAYELAHADLGISYEWNGPRGFTFAFTKQTRSHSEPTEWWLVPKGSGPLLVYRGPRPTRFQSVPECGLSIGPDARELDGLSALVIVGFMLVLSFEWL